MIKKLIQSSKNGWMELLSLMHNKTTMLSTLHCIEFAICKTSLKKKILCAQGTSDVGVITAISINIRLLKNDIQSFFQAIQECCVYLQIMGYIMGLL